MPTLIGLMTSAGILRASGFLDALASLLENLLKPTGFPSALVPLSIVKMFSSSAATSLLLAPYNDFVTGAFDGLKTVVKIMPTLIGLMTGVGILRASGFLDALASLLENLLKPTGFPSALVPLSIVKMFSSSAATSLLLDLYKQHGPDSTIGLTASLILSSTETIFYTLSVYYIAAKVQKTRYTLPGALLATLSGIIASTVIANLM
mgnify:CR=1 FL=1